MKSLFLCGVVLVGCSTTRSNAPSAVEERNAAALHTQQADRERAKFDDTQTRSAPVRSPLGDGSPDIVFDTYNPTAGHLVAADGEMREASSHLDAARKIEAFQDARCKDIPTAQRAACPLLASAVTQVSETAKGIVLVFKPGVDAEDTHRRLQCHLAYAETQGFAQPSCPLFVKGLSMNMQRGNIHALELTGDSPASVAELKKQARRVFLGTMPVSSRTSVTGHSSTRRSSRS